jgi:putative SOS response-associated peptidase YedK
MPADLQHRDPVFLKRSRAQRWLRRRPSDSKLARVCRIQ